MAVFTYQGRGAAGIAERARSRPPTARRRWASFAGDPFSSPRSAEKTGGRRLRSRPAGKVKDKEMAIFTRQFSTMIDAGLPLVQCLNILAEQSESKNLRDVTGQVARTVEEGSTLADALRRHPRTFDDLFTNLVEVGETGGILDVVLQRLAAYIEKAAALKRKVKSAMVYPAASSASPCSSSCFMLTFVIPTFAQMFKDLGAELPLPTQIVIWLSDFVRDVHSGSSSRGLIGCGLRPPLLLPDGERAVHHRRADPQAARVRNAHPQGRRGALHAHARHARPVRRAHPRGPAHHRDAPPATRSSRRPSCSAAPRSPKARPSPSRSRSPACSRPWSSR